MLWCMPNKAPANAIWLVLLIASLAFPAPPANAAPSQWNPIGKWAYDTERERCAAAHAFSNGTKRVTLGFSMRPMSDGLVLIFEVPATIVGIKIEAVKVRIGDQKLPLDSAMAAPSTKAHHVIYELYLDRSQLS